MKKLKWINTAALAALLIVNALANLIPIGGRTTGEVSDLYCNLFTPAPFTFAIWGAIYLLFAGFVIYQWEAFDHGVYSAALRDAIGPWFALGCVFNIAWLFSWHYDAIGLSVFCIFGVLISLIVVESRIGMPRGNLFQRMMAKSGFDLCFGWIIAATISNICVWLKKIEWNGWGLSDEFWTAAALLAGAAIGVAAVLRLRNRLAGAAIAWAYIGILIRHLSESGFDGAYPFATAAAVVGLTAVAGASAADLIREMKRE